MIRSISDFLLRRLLPAALFAGLGILSSPPRLVAQKAATTCFGVQATIVGTNRDDALTGTPAADVIAGLEGNDVIRGLEGNDLICGGQGKDEIRGGSGEDRIDGGNAEDRLFGEDGADEVLGDNGVDLMEGGSGEDRLDGGRGDDTLEGGPGLDQLDGGQGDDTLRGGGEDDLLRGGQGNDRLTGGFGRDRLQGEEGDDTLEGSDYDDVLDGGAGADALDGGPGSDICLNGERTANCELDALERSPVADAGADLSAAVGYPIALDGSGSYDPEEALLTYAWTLAQKPSGSSAALAEPARPEPFFKPDVAGEYAFDLAVSDGASSSVPDRIVVTASAGNAPPDARAGRDRTALLGSPISLDGGGSQEPEGTALSYLWSLASTPPGSRLTDADLAGKDGPRPSFTPDVVGPYVLRLQAGDGALTSADTVQVVAVHAGSAGPFGEAGPDRAFRPGVEASLQSNSSDPDNVPSPLRLTWNLIARPAGSALTTASLLDAGTGMPRFLPDAEGAYVLRLKASDGERYEEDNAVVFVEGTPPDIQITSPAEGAVLDNARPTVTVTYSDLGSGIDLGSYRTLLDGTDVTATTSVTRVAASYTPASPLTPGQKEVVATIADRAGNTSTATVRFTVRSPFRAIADCAPRSGTRPLTVLFRSRGEFSGGSIVRYRWDFQGNGTFDTNDAVARDIHFTFTTAGTFNAVLEVMNNLGQVATDVCTVQVSGNAPTATANASPSNGPVPLQVSFTCAGSDPDGSITRYEWDFEGDGTYDFSSPTSGSTTHTYTGTGQFQARCRVTDNEGKTGEARTTTTVIRPAPPGSPSVTATGSPASGNAPLRVTFNGSATDDGSIVKWEWDFDGDGTFDFTSATSPSTSFTYANGGIFAAALRATDDAGLTGIDTVEVVVNLTATLSIPDDTFDPAAGETATVRTTISAGVPVRVFLKDGAGTVVRNLASGMRAAGTHDDVWDGKDDAGQLLPQATYYAVLEYQFSGETRTVDLTNTTGGTRYNPTRNSFPSTFRPFEDDHLTANFTVPSSQGASEIQAFVGLFNRDTRIITLLERVPFGVGTHTIRWDGLDANGKFAVAPPGDRFLFGIFGFRLPDNAIFIQSAPVISNVKVDPNYFDPATPSFLSPDRPTAVIRFDLSKAADVELTVTNLATGGVLRRIARPITAAGIGLTIAWDGLADDGLFVDKGDYRLTLQAVDSTGSASISRFALVRVFY